MCFVPVSITGSTVHFAHGRAFPGIIAPKTSFSIAPLASPLRGGGLLGVAASF
jgi:hypothetical protein